MFYMHFSNEEGMCEYSGVAEEYNQCVKAHSSDELEEWNDRARYRQAKLKLAQQNNAADSTYQNVSEFSSELHGAEVTSDDALEVHLIEKNASCTWNFHIEVVNFLVALRLLCSEVVLQSLSILA